MVWTADMFSGITTEVIAILPVVLPVAVGLLAIGIALRYAKKVIRMFS